MTNGISQAIKKKVPKISLCHEICALLNMPQQFIYPTDDISFETKVTETLVEALVTYGKSRKIITKISQISKYICQHMGLGKKYCIVLEIASLIYDIGNLSIDVEIYNKDMKLSFEEFEVIKHHTIIGYDALRAQHNPTFDMAALVALQHHEWYDGTGYPQGIKGKEIFLASKIISLSETVVTLHHKRPGREKISFDEIITHIVKRKDLQFDPDIVGCFLEHKDEIREILSSQ